MHLGEVDAAPVPVARAHVAGLEHAHLVLRDLERLGQVRPRPVRVLRGVGHVQLVVVPVGERVRELERDVLLGRLVEDGLDRRVGPRVVGIAAHEGRRHRDDRAVELVRELLLGRRLHRLEHVERRREHFVLHVDLAHGLVGDVLAVRGDDRDRRADLEDLLAEEEPRRVGRAQEDVLVDVGEVAAMEDLADAGELLGLADVHALDLRVWVAAAQRAHEEHARHPHVLGVLAEARDDPEALQARDVCPDDLEGADGGKLVLRGCRQARAGQLVAVYLEDIR